MFKYLVVTKNSFTFVKSKKKGEILPIRLHVPKTYIGWSPN